MALSNKEVVRVGLESTYADLATTLETALVVGDVSFDPSAANRPQRNVNRPRGGGQAFMTGYKHATLGFATELSAPLVAGEAAPYELLLKGCGIAVTPTVSKRRYNPILLNDPSLSFLVYKNANLHRMPGARGAASFSIKVGEQPMLNMQFSGRMASYASEAFPIVTPLQGKLQSVQPKDQSGGIVATLGGADLCIQSIEGSWNTNVAHSEDSCNEWKITDHLSSLSLVCTMPDFTTKNWLEAMEGQEVGAFNTKYGAATFETAVLAPKCSIGQVKYGKSAAGHTVTIPLSCLDDVGNDSLTLETGDLS